MGNLRPVKIILPLKQQKHKPSRKEVNLLKTKDLNKDIRKKQMETGVRNYEIAQHLNISIYTYQHWLMAEMPAERKEMVLKAIEEIKYHESK